MQRVHLVILLLQGRLNLVDRKCIQLGVAGSEYAQAIVGSKFAIGLPRIKGIWLLCVHIAALLTWGTPDWEGV